MCRYAVVVLFIVIVAKAHSSGPFSVIRSLAVSQMLLGEMKETKQTDCDLPSDYPASCVALNAAIANLISPIQNLENVNADTLNSYLDQWCKPECTGPILKSYDCLGLSDYVHFLNDAYCAQYNGRYCYSHWIDGVTHGFVEESSTCGQSGSCSSGCQSTLQTTADFLGCCAPGLYDNRRFTSPLSSILFSSLRAMSIWEKCAMGPALSDWVWRQSLCAWLSLSPTWFSDANGEQELTISSLSRA